MTVIAREQQRLDRLAQEARELDGHIIPISQDYSDSELFEDALKRVVDGAGPIKLAVCWIHSSAPDAPHAVARVMNQGPEKCRYVHLLGSAAADPSAPDPALGVRFRQYDRILYQQVVLGFVIDGDTSRWLDNDEISAGVIEAIERDRSRFVVGTLRPWSARP